jgi:hypothetical protein
MSSEKPSYWQAFLGHRYNKLLMLGVTAASVLASVPFGWDALGLGMLGLAAIEMIGLAIVPGLPNFQLAVNERVRREHRLAARERLLQEVMAHGGSSHLSSYDQMSRRIASLYRTAGDASTSLTTREVEQLDDLTLAYLRMCLSDAVLRSPEGGDFAAGVNRKLRQVDERLSGGNLGQDEEAQLRRAKAEYEEALAVYQMVMTAPKDGSLGELLEESVAKLRLAEEAALDIAQAMDPLGAARANGLKAAPAQPAARRAVGQKQ